MSVKASVSMSDQQDSFARQLVAEGKFSSVSAVVQRGLDLLRHETDLQEAEVAALRSLLEERRQGEFLSLSEGRDLTEQMIEAKKAEYGL